MRFAKLVRGMSNRTGNLPLRPGIFPDYWAPVIVARNEMKDEEGRAA
jgi:hypothetical protein